MTTLADFRDRIKYALGITGASTERGFDNNSIDKHTVQAVEEFSLALPLRLRADVAVAGGARSFELTGLTRPIAVHAVEYPVGQWPRALLDFDVWGTTVTLDHGPPAAGYTVRVYYTAQHLVDGAGSTVQPEHEHLIVEGATALALLARSAGAAQTFETATAQPTTYQHLRIAQVRLDRWRRSIRALGGQWRGRSFYPPHTAPVGRDVVTFPW
jgi:hypothetical protein